MAHRSQLAVLLGALVVGGASAAGQVVHRGTPSALPPLVAPVGAERCAADELPPLAAQLPLPALAAGEGKGPVEMLAAVVAVETDYELYQRLGSVQAVITHVEQLFATASAIYRRDLGVDLALGTIEVWAVPEDPFTVESSFLDALYELGDHWHAAHADVPRALVHLVSGKAGLLGGIGYHGVVCREDTPVGGHWGGGYSLSGAHGVFGPFRDAFITAHELGHNFRAYHTHCFNDLPNPGAPPVDECYSGETRNDGQGCYLGPTSMPPSGGSVMSYCHLLGGGYANVTLALSGAGLFGSASERVTDRMRAHIATVSCLVPADLEIFADGFESGDCSAWSATVP